MFACLLAGKTTLLNALSGRATYARVQGDVTFNGHAVTRNDLDFVPQFDELSSA
jgi:Fe-S cluster assembly ATPase SufC